MRLLLAVAFLTFLSGNLLCAQEPNPAKSVIDLETKLLTLDAKGKLAAAKSLEDVAIAMRLSVSTLEVLVKNERDAKVRRQAIITLATLGPLARKAIPTLIKVLDDQNEDMRIAAIGAIGATAPFSKVAIPKLIKFVKDPNPIARRAAIVALGQFGPEAKEAVAVLIAALDDPDEGVPGKVASVKVCAQLALREIGPDAKQAVSALMKIQDIGDAKLRGMTLGTLAKIIPTDPTLIPLLVGVLKNKENKGLRASAAYAIGILGPNGKAAVSDLIKALAMDDYGDADLTFRTKMSIIWALGEIGAGAKDAVPALEAIVSKGDRMLHSEAKASIKKIQGSK